ncbi:MAG: STAS domain-containing protein [Alphaproteobacteria bacterium]|nr:STAS domain-containing protein [Alphaproteobacteria bacterium]
MLTTYILKEEDLNIEMSGSLRFEDYATFKTAVDELERYDGRRVHLNLSDMDITDPAGIGMLLILSDAARRRGIELCLSGVSAKTQQVFNWCPMLQTSSVDGDNGQSISKSCSDRQCAFKTGSRFQ